MKEEIKEKDILQKSIECLTNAKLNNTTYEVARDIVLDYITNLQEENKRLEHDYKIALKLISRYEKRIDKATKKLKTLMPICIMPNNTLIHGTEKVKTIEETLNILQGSDK